MVSEAKPDWQVTAVFDPAGTGGDFAYTVGLWPRVPELHLWARPTDGTDPGADFKLTPQDCTLILNDMARRALAGDLAAGSVHTSDADGGFTTLRFTVADPAPARSLEAFGAHDAPVCTLRWEVQRPVVADPAPISDAVAARIAHRAAHLRALPDPMFPGQVIEPVDVSPDQEFGPWTSVVTEMRRQLLDQPAERAAWLLRALAVTATLRHTLGVSHAAARTVGRVACIEAAGAAANADADVLTTLLTDDDDGPEDAQFRVALQSLLATTLAAAYSAQVVADVLEVANRSLLRAATALVDATIDPYTAADVLCARPDVVAVLEWAATLDGDARAALDASGEARDDQVADQARGIAAVAGFGAPDRLGEHLGWADGSHEVAELVVGDLLIAAAIAGAVPAPMIATLRRPAAAALGDAVPE